MRHRLRQQAVAVSLALQPLAVHALTLNLEDSIQLAIHSSTPALKAERDQDVGGTRLLQGYLEFLPDLNATGNYTVMKGTQYFTQALPTMVRGSSLGPSYLVSTTLNIFNGLKDLAGLRAAMDRKNAADKNVYRVKQQISLDIAQSYLQVILDQKLVGIAENNLKTSRERETLLKEQTKVGVRNMADLFRQQAQTSADESYAINTKAQRKTDLIALLRKLRLDPSQPAELTEPPQLVAHSKKLSLAPVKKLTEIALEQRADFTISKLAHTSAQWDVTSARAAYMPRLDFVATYGAAARHFDFQRVNGVDVTPTNQLSFDSQLGHQTDYTYGVMLSWNLFDRWVTSANVEAAKAQAFKAGLDEEDFQRQVIGEVEQSANDFDASYQQLLASEKGVKAARKAYEVSQGRYEVGSLNFIDLSTAQVVLVQAEAAEAQAIIGHELHRRAVDFATGTTPIAP